jgi:truncated hemoglobin YjbI
MKSIPLSRPRLKVLYENIGAAQGLEKILQDFYARMSRDVMIGFFFAEKDVSAIAKKQQEFLTRAWGMAESYSGKSPAQAHEKLPPILSGHFDRRLRLLEETLKLYQLNPEDIRIWIEFEGAFREVIVKS